MNLKFQKELIKFLLRDQALQVQLKGPNECKAGTTITGLHNLTVAILLCRKLYVVIYI